LCFTSFRGLGLANNNKGDFLEALRYYRNALAIYLSFGDRRGIADINNLIGYLYTVKKNPNIGLMYLSKAEQINRGLGNSLALTRVLSNIGNAYYHQEKLD